MQLQPDIIVKKLAQSATSGKALLPEFSDPNQPSALDLDASAVNGKVATPSATPALYDRSWTIRNLLGTFRYSRNRYSIVKRYDFDYKIKKREVEEIRAEYRGPSWLINRLWRIQAVKASFGWSFHLRTYNIVPWNSPVFALARKNSVKGLQELFNKKEASPFDCNENDMTLLLVSIIIGSAKNIKH